MGDGKSNVGAKSAVGDELAAVLPDIPWYKRSHLIRLNFIIASLTLFCKYPLSGSAQCKMKLSLLILFDVQRLPMDTMDL